MKRIKKKGGERKPHGQEGQPKEERSKRLGPQESEGGNEIVAK